jgi:apoptosis-inducing factor 3
MYRLAALADLADLVPITLTVREREIAVVRIEDEIYAFDAYCTHRRAPLADGAVTRKRTVLCPWHLGTFRLTDGRVVAGPPDTGIGSYPVVLRDGCAWLDDDLDDPPREC